MVVHCKEVINMREHYSKHYISGRNLNTHGEEWQGRACVFIPLHQPLMTD